MSRTDSAATAVGTRSGLIFALCAVLAVPAHGRRPTSRRRLVEVIPLTVQATRRTDLFSKPGKQGRFVGTLVRGTRVPIIRARYGRRCEGGRWYEVATGAWMCASHGRPSWRLPAGVPQPVLPPGHLTPRVAFYARRDGVPIYLTKADAAAGRHDRLVERGFSFSIHYGLRIGKRRFIRTRRSEIVPREDLWRYRPSEFQGRFLKGKPAIPLGCSIAYRGTPIRQRANRHAPRRGRLAHHQWVEIHETRGRGKNRFHRIGPDQWVRANVIRRIRFSAPPAGIRPGERWVEVLLREQTLVAYEGATPVLATLVSTGRFEHKTPRGLFRVRTKVALSTMTNRKGADELYRVDDVPWIQYVHEGYALHGTYWHSSFGVVKSHGCINLAPKDARWLFSWAPPALRPGWGAFETTASHPGILVRVRLTPQSPVRYRGPRDQAPGRPSVADR